jgi:FdhE protein
MPGDYDRRIARARELAITMPESSEMLAFYAGLAGFQKTVFESFRSAGETSLHRLAEFVPGLGQLLGKSGTPELKALASEAIDWVVIERYWEGDRSADPARQFLARALVQPYAEYLASRGIPDAPSTASVCPFCGARPVAGVLRGEGEGAKRSLICSLCATEWAFRRVVCPNCGEEDKEKLPVFRVEDAPGHVRIDACDSCGGYLKSVDLSRDGHAIPVVDELATVALSIWAEEQGYSKAEGNLLGM